LSRAGLTIKGLGVPKDKFEITMAAPQELATALYCAQSCADLLGLGLEKDTCCSDFILIEEVFALSPTRIVIKSTNRLNVIN